MNRLNMVYRQQDINKVGGADNIRPYKLKANG